MMNETPELNDDGLLESKVNGVDGDGTQDVPGMAADLDGNGIPDVSDVSVNQDGNDISDGSPVHEDTDGVQDIFASRDEANAIWGSEQDMDTNLVAADPIDTLSNTYSALSFDGYNELVEVHGTPDADMALWNPQASPMSCAVATTNMMFNSLGMDIGEPVINAAFNDLGIYNPMVGTTSHLIDDAINIMANMADIDLQATEFTFNDVDDLMQLLDNGVRPLIMVDAGELYSGNLERALNDLGILPGQGHAVQLTGIEHTPEGDFIRLNDPGVPDGAGVRIPFEQFADAAEDYGSRGVALAGHQTPEDIRYALAGNPEASDAVTLGASTEPLHSDVFGKVYRGNSIIPVMQIPKQTNF